MMTTLTTTDEVHFNRHILAITMLLIAFDGGTFAQAKGRPPKDDPPPGLPDVRYALEPMNIQEQYTDVKQMNNNGLAVGWVSETAQGSDLHAFLYDHDGFVSPTEPQKLYNLDDLLRAQLPDGGVGWRLSSTLGVNRWGDVVGQAVDPLSNRWGFVVDTSAVGLDNPTVFSNPAAAMSDDPNDWTLQLLPNLGSSFATATRINDNGIVLAEYTRASDDTRDAFLYNPFQPEDAPDTLGLDIRLHGDGNAELNNANQVAGVLSDGGAFFVYDPVAGVQIIDDRRGFRTIDGLNDSGVVSGVVSDRGKLGGGPFRYSDQLELAETIASGAEAHINEEQDLLAATYLSSGAHSLSHAGFSPDFNEQAFLIDDLIDENDPLRGEWTNPNLWNSLDGLTDRDPITGFPRLYGAFKSSDGRQRGVILTPFSTGGTGASAVPEPVAGWLLATAAGMLLISARRGGLRKALLRRPS